ncbi:hypothetical protein [Curvivirga aplysinae]|uniref:hypothetical protein n=1 Tax=Curvivirga aplysinae TaxID=2529852 RepID=UPI0012BC20C4|nr:hypothetical protein [Curvivirga aplysinae]MTI08865.1 hypothetical protein [Curvivirga aplysinae]
MTFEDKLQTAMQAPNDQDIWADLFLTGFQGKLHPLLPTLMDQREKLFHDTPQLVFKAFWRDNIYEDQQLHDNIVKFTTDTKDTTVPLTALRFFSAAMLIKAGNVDKAIQELQIAEVGLMNNVEQFKELPHFLLIPGMLQMLDSLKEVSDAENTLPAPRETGEWFIDWVKAPKIDAKKIIFTSCNGVYWRKFGPDFLKAVEGKAPIHLHLVNPEDGQENALADTDLSYSIERQVERASSPYYACGRFLVLPELLAKTNADIIMLDVDLIQIHDFKTLVQETEKGDISYFAMRTLIPWLRHHAAFIHWTNNEAVKRYASLLQKLLWDKLAGTNWYVDQLALLSLYNFFQQEDNDPTPNFHLLEQDQDFAFGKYILPAGEDHEKWELRKEAGL